MATGQIPTSPATVGLACTKGVLKYSTGSGNVMLDFYRNKTDYISLVFYTASSGASVGRVLIEDHYLDTNPDSPTYNTMLTVVRWDRTIPA